MCAGSDQTSDSLPKGRTAMKRAAFWTCVVVLSVGATAAHAQVVGTGTPNRIPVWTDATTIGDSSILQGSDGGLVINTANAGSGVYATTGGASSTGVTGVELSDAGGVGVWGEAKTTTSPGFGVTGVAHGTGGVGVAGYSPFQAVLGINQDCDSGICTPVAGTAGTFVTLMGGTILRGFQVDSQGFNVSTFRVDSTGQVFANGGYQTGGADFAESMAVAGERSRYEPGEVVVIEESGRRQVGLAREAYSTLVAGIY